MPGGEFQRSSQHLLWTSRPYLRTSTPMYWYKVRRWLAMSSPYEDGRLLSLGSAMDELFLNMGITHIALAEVLDDSRTSAPENKT